MSDEEREQKWFLCKPRRNLWLFRTGLDWIKRTRAGNYRASHALYYVLVDDTRCSQIVTERFRSLRSAKRWIESQKYELPEPVNR